MNKKENSNLLFTSGTNIDSDPLSHKKSLSTPLVDNIFLSIVGTI